MKNTPSRKNAAKNAGSGVDKHAGSVAHNFHITPETFATLDSCYTGETILHEDKTYSVLDFSHLSQEELIAFFWGEQAMRWKKTAPTLIRKAIPGEAIVTYVKDKEGVTHEKSNVAGEWQFVFRNPGTDDIYIPSRNAEKLLTEYNINDLSELSETEFAPFVPTGKASRIPVGIINKPTALRVVSRNDVQKLGVWATLKLEDRGDKYEITGLNQWWFEARSITDKQGNIVT